MTLYRDMTTPQLAEQALGFHTHQRGAYRLIYALAKRLEQEYERANRHCAKVTEVAQDYVAHRTRAAIAERKLAEYEHGLTGYIKVAKPHIQQVFTVPGNKGMWRCTGPFGTVQYGGTPSQAYTAWRKVMEQGHGIPRKPARFRFNYMRNS